MFVWGMGVVLYVCGYGLLAVPKSICLIKRFFPVKSFINKMCCDPNLSDSVMQGYTLLC